MYISQPAYFLNEKVSSRAMSQQTFLDIFFARGGLCVNSLSHARYCISFTRSRKKVNARDRRPEDVFSSRRVFERSEKESESFDRAAAKNSNRIRNDRILPPSPSASSKPTRVDPNFGDGCLVVFTENHSRVAEAFTKWIGRARGRVRRRRE